MNWIKWHHGGVPDVEGELRDKIRKKLSLLGHCKPCTALSGCYFGVEKKPDYPQHPSCDCFLLPVAVTYGNVVAYCNITKFTGYIFKLDNSG